MKTAEKLSQVDKDINSGKKRTAMNRLQGLINAYPNELEFRRRLGTLYHDLGFKEYAGQYWILLQPETEEMKESVQIYRNSVGNSGYKILLDLKFKGDKEALPVHSREVLDELEKHSKKTNNHVPKYIHKSPNHTIEQSKSGFTIVPIIIVGVFLVIGILIVIGLVTVIKWII